MSGICRGLIKIVMPDVNIIADQFHRMKIVGGEFNSALIKAKRTNEAFPGSEEQETIKKALKNIKYVLLKPEYNLAENQRVKLTEVMNICPDLAKMHQ